MKIKLIIVFGLLLTVFNLLATEEIKTVAQENVVVAMPEAKTVVGRWKTIDDETKKAKSIVEITEADGKLTGKVIQIFRNADEDQNPKCDKCDGEKKDQPIIGMTIIWKLEKDGTEWKGGNILDPKNGKTYKCKIKLIDDGKKIEVRGFIGFSLLGRTQTWERE